MKKVIKSPLRPIDVTATYKNYIALFLDALGFSETVKRTSRDSNSEENRKINGFFRRDAKYKVLFNLYQKAGANVHYLNMSDSILIYEEIKGSDDEELGSKAASILGIGRQIQRDLLGLSAILTKGAIMIGEGSFGEIDGVYTGPILAQLVSKEKEIEMPVIYTPNQLKEQIMSRRQSIREIALQQLGTSSINFATLDEKSSYPKYIDFEIGSDSPDRYSLRMLIEEAAKNLRCEDVKIQAKWRWLVDQIIDLNLPPLDKNGNKFIDFLNQRLEKPYYR